MQYNIIVPNYREIKIEMEPKEVTDFDVEMTLEELQRKMAKKNPSKDGVKEGDTVIVDYEGRDEEEIVQMAAKDERFIMIFGEKAPLLPEFVKNLIGARKEEKRTFSMKFPKNYFKKDLQEKTLQFTVLIKEIYILELPAWDYVVKEVLGEGKNLEDLKKRIREELKAKRTKNSESEKKGRILKYIVDHTKVDVPEDLIENEINYLMEVMYLDGEQRGISREQYDEKLKRENRDPRKQFKETAKKNVTLQLALEVIFSEPEWQINDEEIIKANGISKLETEEEKKQIIRSLQLKKLYKKVLEGQQM